MNRLHLTTLAIAAIISSAAAFADQGDDCPPGDGYALCRARAGDPLGMYAAGREAYDKARASGDFTEALDWARKLKTMGEKNGERLLKMVHLQLGWGAHRDLVQAWSWLTEDLATGDTYITPLRRQLEEKMSPEQLAQAKSKGKQ